MKWFCADVPEHLIVSTLNLTRHAHTGNRQLHKTKMPWTPELVELAYRMHEEGEGWSTVALELEDRTGIRLSKFAVQDYVERRREI